MSGSLHTPAYRRFLDALVAFRKGKGVTQVQLAERIGRTQVWVSKCERGDRRLDVIEIVELARGIGVEPSEIMALAAAALDGAAPGEGSNDEGLDDEGSGSDAGVGTGRA